MQDILNKARNMKDSDDSSFSHRSLMKQSVIQRGHLSYQGSFTLFMQRFSVQTYILNQTHYLINITYYYDSLCIKLHSDE